MADGTLHQDAASGRQPQKVVRVACVEAFFDVRLHRLCDVVIKTGLGRVAVRCGRKFFSGDICRW